MSYLPGFKPERYPAEFLAWWRSYPRRVAKQDAAKAWQQTAHIRPSLEVLVEITRHHDLMWAERAINAEHIPYPASWLRGARWEDELIWHAIGPDGTRASRTWKPTDLLEPTDHVDA